MKNLKVYILFSLLLITLFGCSVNEPNENSDITDEPVEDLHWKRIGPFGGRTTKIRAYGNNLYVSTDFMGLKKSTDRGLTWDPKCINNN